MLGNGRGAYFCNITVDVTVNVTLEFEVVFLLCTSVLAFSSRTIYYRRRVTWLSPTAGCWLLGIYNSLLFVDKFKEMSTTRGLPQKGIEINYLSAQVAPALLFLHGPDH